MAVRNGTIVITEKTQVLYLIAVYMDPAGIRDHRKSSKFFIFDPVARRYICLMNKKKHRFVAKRYPKPNEELCWFLEETSDHGVDVRYVVEADKKEYALRFSKNGKLMRPTTKSARSEYFRSRLEDLECENAVDRFCSSVNHQKRHQNKPLTIRNICPPTNKITHVK